MSHQPIVAGFFERRTGSIQYIVSCPATQRCAIIDPVLDYDEKSGSVGTASADALLDYIKTKGLRLEWILDTHPHADHFSAAAYLRRRTGVAIGIGEHVRDVQTLWAEIYNLPIVGQSSVWDRLFVDGEEFRIGDLTARVIHSPGHTLASVTYLIGDAAFVHDTMFMPDSGTARADFPGGNAAQLWASIQAILALPPATRVFTGHDYRPGGREPRWESTVDQQRNTNIHLTQCSDKTAFIAFRDKRDQTLPMPRLLLHALQINLSAGQLPAPDCNGRRYLKIPLNAFPGTLWE